MLPLRSASISWKKWWVLSPINFQVSEEIQRAQGLPGIQTAGLAAGPASPSDLCCVWTRTSGGENCQDSNYHFRRHEITLCTPWGWRSILTAFLHWLKIPVSVLYSLISCLLSACVFHSCSRSWRNSSEQTDENPSPVFHSSTLCFPQFSDSLYCHLFFLPYLLPHCGFPLASKVDSVAVFPVPSCFLWEPVPSVISFLCILPLVHFLFGLTSYKYVQLALIY